MSEKMKRSYNDDDQEPNDDIDQLINRINFNQQLANSYKTRDQQYKQRLDLLNSQLKQLNNGKLDGYKQKLSEIETLYEDHLRMIKLWYQIKKSEIECQYEIEQKTALHEYQEKRKEIKDNLKHEYEEKRRAIENEKHALDINLDSNEPKPTITRKLRRRVNQSQTNLNQHDLQFTSLILNSSIATPNTSHMALNSCIQLNNSVQMQNSLNIQSIVNIAQTQEQQRKRRPSPSTQIACTLNDDEICDDLKYLIKNSNLLPSQIFSVFNSMQQNDAIKFDVLSNC